MRLKTKLYDDWIVVTVDMGINAVKSLEYLPHKPIEGFGERVPYSRLNTRATIILSCVVRTNFAWEHAFVVDIVLHPGHEMLNVFWCCHFRGSFEAVGVLPKILKPALISAAVEGGESNTRP